ncbi:MAG: universal stress protein [Devosia sp.]
MSYRSIAVYAGTDPQGSPALSAAIDLATRMDAHLIGVAAETMPPIYFGFDADAVAGELYASEREAAEHRLVAAEEMFRVRVPKTIGIEWHGFVGDPVDSLIGVAHRADLLVVPNWRSLVLSSSPRTIDAGALALSAGRPVLALGENTPAFDPRTILIAWKNTREARRAVADALPFLSTASKVVAMTISEGDEGLERLNLDSLVAWLKRHGVNAQPEFVVTEGGYADIVASWARANDIDLIVSGAYGHSRMREWLLGGMTRDLVEAHDLNRLLCN